MFPHLYALGLTSEDGDLSEIPFAALDEPLFSRLARVESSKRLWREGVEEDVPLLIVDVRSPGLRQQMVTFISLRYPVAHLLLSVGWRTFFVKGDHSDYIKREILKSVDFSWATEARRLTEEKAKAEWTSTAAFEDRSCMEARLLGYHGQIGERVPSAEISSDDHEARSLVSLSDEYGLKWTREQLRRLLCCPSLVRFSERILQRIPHGEASACRGESATEENRRLLGCLSEAERICHFKRSPIEDFVLPLDHSLCGPLTSGDLPSFKRALSEMTGGWLSSIECGKTLLAGDLLFAVADWWNRRQRRQLSEWIDIAYPRLFTVHQVTLEGTRIPPFSHVAFLHDCRHVCSPGQRACRCSPRTVQGLEEAVKTLSQYHRKERVNIRREGDLLIVEDVRGGSLRPVRLLMVEGIPVTLVIEASSGEEFRRIAEGHLEIVKRSWPRARFGDESGSGSLISIVSPQMGDYIEGFRRVNLVRCDVRGIADSPLPCNRLWMRLDSERVPTATASGLHSLQTASVSDHYRLLDSNPWDIINSYEARGIRNNLPGHNPYLQTALLEPHMRCSSGFMQDRSSGYFNLLAAVGIDNHRWIRGEGLCCFKRSLERKR